MRSSASTRSGLPHRRVEEWKYTDLRALMREAKPLAAPPDAAAKRAQRRPATILSGVDADGMVFVDGRFRAGAVAISTPRAGHYDRIEWPSSLAKAIRWSPACRQDLGTDDAAVALNTAFMGDGAAICVVDGHAIAKPIHIAHVFAGGSATPSSVFIRSLVVIVEQARR